MGNLIDEIKGSKVLVLCDNPKEANSVIQWFVLLGIPYSGWRVRTKEFPMKIGVNPTTNRVDGWGQDVSVPNFFERNHFPIPQIIPFMHWELLMQVTDANESDCLFPAPSELI